MKVQFLRLVSPYVFLELIITLILATSTEADNVANPVVDFIPRPADKRSTLIWYDGTKTSSYMPWVNITSKYLNKYYEPKSPTTVVNCSYSNFPNTNEGKVCDVDIRDWGPCNRDSSYSFHRSAPCIFLELKNIENWKPEFYDDQNSLPQDMPMHLKERIKNTRTAEELENVWVSCEGEHPTDVELIGPVTYYPNSAFPGYYFPYKNNPGYLSPLVAVHFLRPFRGVVINVECRIWAKNINYNKNSATGYVHFELLVE